MLPISSVWPSAVARAACAVPMVPPPPPILSMTMVPSSRAPTWLPQTRPTTSTTPPGGRGTIRRIGPFGYFTSPKAAASGMEVAAKVVRPSLMA